MHNVALNSNKRKKGQSMVEFALVLPILLFFFIGTVEMGLLINDYISLNRALSDTCRYGATLAGYSSAEVLIAGKLIDGLSSNLKRQNLRIKTRLGTKVYSNISKSADGSITANPDSTFSNMFFRYDNETATNFNDDTAVLPQSWRASYVEAMVEYDHDIVIPFAELFSSGKITLTASNTWPVNAHYTSLMPGFAITGGALPITVQKDMCVYTGSPVIIKGDQNMPGGFGWLDLSVTVADGGNPNAGPNDLAAWITNPASAPNQIFPPEDIYTMTGQKNASSVRNALASYLGRRVLVPIYDTTSGTGNKATYHIIGFAEYVLTSIQNYPDITAIFIRTMFLTQ